MVTELYYFTGTGNSLHICKSLKQNIEKRENEVVKIIPISSLDISKPIVTDAKRVGLIYPTYYLDAPNIVKEFTNVIRMDKEAYVFIYTHGGGSIGNSVYAVKKILNNNNITVSNAFTSSYPDNSIAFQTKTNEAKKRFVIADRQHENDADTIYRCESKLDNPLYKFSQGRYIEGKVISAVSLNYYGFKKISSNESCTSCGMCAKVCPMKNIEMKDNKPQFKNHCESCFACIHACPKQALSYKRMPKRKNYQYRHPQVTVNDLIIK